MLERSNEPKNNLVFSQAPLELTEAEIALNIKSKLAIIGEAALARETTFAPAPEKLTGEECVQHGDNFWQDAIALENAGEADQALVYYDAALGSYMDAIWERKSDNILTSDFYLKLARCQSKLAPTIYYPESNLFTAAANSYDKAEELAENEYMEALVLSEKADMEEDRKKFDGALAELRKAKVVLNFAGDSEIKKQLAEHIEQQIADAERLRKGTGEDRRTKTGSFLVKLAVAA